MFKKIIIPLLLILFLASMAAFGAPNYVNIGPTTELDGDIKILSEIVAEGVTPDDWETTILFTDPTADRTITIPDADVTVGIVTGIVPPDHGGTGIANNAASTITITGAFATTLTVTGVTAITLPEAGILVSDGTACTDIEGTGLSIAAGVLNWAAPVNSIDSDAYVDYSIDHEHLHNDVIHGLTLASPLAAADEFIFWDENAGALRKIGWTAFMNSISSITNVSLVIGRDADNNVSWAVDDTLTIEIAGVVSSIVDIETGAGDNDSLVTQGYVDDAVAGGGATAALDNLAAVQINTTLLSDAPDTDSLGTVDAEWLSVFIGDAGRLYFGLAQDISIHRSAAGIMTLTAANGVVTSAGLTVGGTLALGANNITLTGYIGRDADNFIDWTVDDSLTIEIGGVQHDIVSISDGAGDNDKLVTQGYVDDAVVGGGANVALSNLAAVAINTSLLPDAADSWDLGAAADAEWLTLYLGTYGTIYFGVGQTESIAETAVNALLITATDGVSFSDEIWTTNIIGRDVDNYIGWDVDNTLKIEINNVLSSIVSISTGVGDNDKLVTQGYVDDIVGGASLALDNLAAVQINTTLLSDAPDTDSLGTDAAEWLNLYIGDAGRIYLGLSQDVSIHRSAANKMTLTATEIITSSLLTTGGNVVPSAADSKDLGTTLAEWRSIFIGDTGAIYLGMAQDTNISRTGANELTITATGGVKISDSLTLVGGTLILGGNNITMTGSLATTASRITKGWFTSLECTNDITINGTALSAIYANLGANTDITSLTGLTTPLAADYGGTGVANNAAETITMVGDDPIQFTTGGATTVTLPITGTLATLAGAETFTQKVSYNGLVITANTGEITTGLWHGTPLAADYGGTGVANNAAETITMVGDDPITFTTSAATSVTLPASGTLLANLSEDASPQLGAFLDANEFYILIADDMSGDHHVSGLADTQDVGENVVFGDLLYFDWTQTEWMKAKADAYATSRAQRIALETKGDGDACLMLVIGWIRDDSAFDFGASAIFLNDDVAGTCDDTAPAESGDQIQIVGNAISADILFFNPSQDVGEI